jgi:hypothetical protein
MTFLLYMKWAQLLKNAPTKQQGQNEQDEEHEEQNLRDARRCARNATEAEEGRKNGDDEEYEG